MVKRTLTSDNHASDYLSGRYRTIYKPKYKVGYKTVTEMEWRCCPGYSGENCYDGPTSMPDVVMPPIKGSGLPHRPGVKGYPFGPRPPIDHVPGRGQLEPGRPYPGVPDHRPVPSGQLPGESGKTVVKNEPRFRYDTLHLTLFVILGKSRSDWRTFGPYGGRPAPPH